MNKRQFKKLFKKQFGDSIPTPDIIQRRLNNLPNAFIDNIQDMNKMLNDACKKLKDKKEVE